MISHLHVARPACSIASGPLATEAKLRNILDEGRQVLRSKLQDHLLRLRKEYSKLRASYFP